jgi:hypothetical protein
MSKARRIFVVRPGGFLKPNSWNRWALARMRWRKRSTFRYTLGPCTCREPRPSTTGIQQSAIPSAISALPW